MSDYPLLSSASVTSILDDIPDMSFIYRDDGLLVAVNAACERLSGVPRELVVDRFNIYENKQVTTPEMLESYARAFRGEPQFIPLTRLNFDKPGTFDFEVVTSVRWVETLMIPLHKRPDGSAPYVMGIQRDVTGLVEARSEIEAQRATIEALSTPVIEVWEGIVTLPLLGQFSAERADRVAEQVLEAVVRTRARYVILDLTGSALVDASTADQLLRIVAGVRLLGATGVLVGIQADVARALVGIGVDFQRVRIYQNLRQALKACMQEDPR